MPNKLVKSVATTIRELRVSASLGQEDLAELAGLDRTYISGVERGVRNITLDSLESIVNALQIDLKVFLEELKNNIQ